jgi:hypothetical protein
LLFSFPTIQFVAGFRERANDALSPEEYPTQEGGGERIGEIGAGSRFLRALFQFSKRAAGDATKFRRSGVELVVAAARLECGEPPAEAGKLIWRQLGDSLGDFFDFHVMQYSMSLEDPNRAGSCSYAGRPMISRTAFCSAEAARMLAARRFPVSGANTTLGTLLQPRFFLRSARIFSELVTKYGEI